jgi:hypothetical protein
MHIISRMRTTAEVIASHTIKGKIVGHQVVPVFDESVKVPLYVKFSVHRRRKGAIGWWFGSIVMPLRFLDQRVNDKNGKWTAPNGVEYQVYPPRVLRTAEMTEINVQSIIENHQETMMYLF